ncbi:galactokinase [Nesterenkonia alba]|uniref:galactokinase n=1 Tax=Nesterenkonia alba TaxID=515814 RepID=UPI0003B4A4E1|nr:galactokinase family protein [Nesterenkonia alba]
MSISSSRWVSAGDPASIATMLTDQFRVEYGRDSHGVWFAPGRANLNGEHIDFHGGRCLPMALAHGTYVAAAPRTDGVLRLRTLESSLDSGPVEIDADAVTPAADRQQHLSRAEDHDDAHSWTRYVSGVFWALRQIEDPQLRIAAGFGADILISSTLPIGGGLSSSAALECATALACVALGAPLGTDHPEEELTRALTDARRAALAAACMRAEVEVVGAGTGGLDQTTSLRSAEGKLISLDCRDFTLTRVNISFLLRGYRLFAVDTGQPHQLAAAAFGSRRADSEVAMRILSADRLRDTLPARPTLNDVDLVLARFDELAGTADFAGREPLAVRRRLRHALTEMVRSERLHRHFADEARGVDHTAADLGETMTAGHNSMREDAEVSFPLADRIVDAALRRGATGARLIGGGFGGSVLVLAPEASVEQITTTLAHLDAGIRFIEVVPSGPAHAL